MRCFDDLLLVSSNFEQSLKEYENLNPRRACLILQFCSSSVGHNFSWSFFLFVPLQESMFFDYARYRILHFGRFRQEFSCHKKFSTQTQQRQVSPKPTQYNNTTLLNTTMTSSTPQYLATSAGTMTKKRETVWANAPVVMAMLHNNTLSSCRDVTNMLHECSRSGSEDQVCLAAMKHMEMCRIDGRIQ